MKKIIKFLFLLALSFIFMSCVDYVQVISYKNEAYQFYYKITLSKALFELADSNSEEMFDEFDKEALKYLPSNVYAKQINTDLEVGAEFSVRVNPRTTDSTEKALLPTVAGNKCFIPFLLGNKNNKMVDGFKSENDEEETITKGILSSAKCRVMIDKSVLPAIGAAYFEGRSGQKLNLDIFDYGNTFCIEIPFIVLLESYMYRFERIVVIKK